MSWKTEPGESRNEGRIFSVMGRQYIFELTDAGTLALRPYIDPWVLMRSLHRQHEELMASLRSVYDHEVWVGDLQARLKRRQEKARTFTARYAGSTDHSWRQEREGNWPANENWVDDQGRWRTQIPHDNGRVGRMVIRDIPFEF